MVKIGISVWITWTIATCSSLPRKPTAMEAAAITAGPVRNLTAIAKEATEFPQAIILGWRAINRPFKVTTITTKSVRTNT